MKTFLPLILAIAVFGNLTVGANGPSDPVLSPCWVKVKKEVEISAQKEGVITEMSVIEGSSVKEGDKIAVIDDREAKAALDIARFAHQAAQARAADDIEARFAAKSAEVAKKDWERDLSANEQVPGSVPEIEVEQKRLMYEKSILQMEKAQKDQHLASLDAQVKKAEEGAAEVALEKRSIFAPFDGEVVKLLREKSEWVNPGDPILTLMRFDKLYVEAFVAARDFDRAELMGRPVTVSIQRARGKEITLEGTVIHVGQLIESGGNYLVRAEIANTREDNNWAVQPGMGQQARMTVHLQGAVAAK